MRSFLDGSRQRLCLDTTSTFLGGGGNGLVGGSGAQIGNNSTVANGAISSGEITETSKIDGASSYTPINVAPGGTAGPITIDQASPQDVALAAQAYEDSLQIVQGEITSTSQMASGQLSTAEQLAKDSTATSSEQFNNLILIVGGLAVVGAGIYFYLKKG
jgi:hypothetical protein